MSEIITESEPRVAVVLRRSGRARRMSLRVSSLDGKVTLTVPNWATEAEARAFVRSKEGWIAKARAGLPERCRAVEAVALPFEGRELPLERSAVRSARLSDDGSRLLVPCEGPVGSSLRNYLKLAARARLSRAAEDHAATLGRAISGIALRDTRSRWGSCSSSGQLSFSWRLIMAPVQVLDYVALHEAAHLVHMNHGAAYWALVERHCPDYRQHRDWLRARGPELHRWDFDD